MIRLAWSTAAALLLALVPLGLAAGRPPWVMPEALPLLGGLVASYLVATVLVSWTASGRGPSRWLGAALAATAGFTPLLFALALASPDYSKGVLLLGVPFGILLAVVPETVRETGLRRASVAALIVAAVALGLGKAGEDGQGWTLGTVAGSITAPTDPRLETTLRPSIFYTLRARSFQNHFDTRVPGGGLTAVAGGYLVVTAEGTVSFATYDEGAATLDVRPLPGALDLDAEGYFAQAIPEAVPPWWRATGVLAEESGDTVRIFVAHNYWDATQGCGMLRVSAVETTRAALVSGEPLPPWTVVYDTQPCRQLETEGQGGRLGRMPDGALLLTVGAHGFDGMRREEYLSQNPDLDYGKTIRIDPETGEGQVYTLGHRNPQGLYVDPDGDIWQTEHGPVGGDELNLLVPGANYGWPMVTQGLPYDGATLPSGIAAGRHDGFQPPAYAWLPSIGISELVGITRPRFPVWQGDLVVGSLVDLSLWRVRPRAGHVVFVERIPVGVRVRSLVEDPEGRLVLWTDGGALVVLEESEGNEPTATAPAMSGELLFGGCLGCHPTGGNVVGPGLEGVLGRAVASTPGFEFSPALQALGGRWDTERLDAFLEDPQGFAPGNRMTFPGLPSPADRRALIDYLRGR